MVGRRALSLCAVLLSLVTAASPAMAACSGPSYFEGYFPVAMSHDANELAVADLDNDGETDLITVSTTAGTINVRLGNGGGSFDSVLSYPAPSPEEIAVGDLNGDGFADIVVSSEPGTNEECISFGGCAGFSVLLNDGDGTFGNATTTIVPFSASIVSVDVANFDADHLDVLIGAPPINSTDPAIHVFHGDGAGGFDDRTSWSVDGNGQLFDVEAVNINVPSGALSDIVAIVGPGSTSTFTRALIYGVGPTVAASRVIDGADVVDGEVAAGDFNGDGWLDLAPLTRTATQSSVQIWLQNTFGPGSAGGFPAGITDLAVADIDEDGDVDIMTARGTNNWYARKMNGHVFEVQAVEQSFDPAGTMTRVIANDFNRDGRMDFVFLDTANDMVRLLSNTCSARYATVTVNSSPNPSTFGSDATFTVSVQGRENAGVPDGGVTLYEGSTVLGTATLNDAGNAFITLSNLSVGSHTVHAVYDGGIGQFGSQTSADYVHTVSAPPFGPPSNVVATGNGAANQISISWTATSDTMNYDVLRRENGGWTVITTTPNTSYVDTNVVNTSAYFYAVRARRNNNELSSESNADIATTATLVLPGDKKIRATDVTTTRSLINSLRVAAGLTAFTYTDTSLTGVQVKAVHYTELRDTLNPARTLLGLAPVTFPNTVAAGQTIQRTDIQTIRNSMQ